MDKSINIYKSAFYVLITLLLMGASFVGGMYYQKNIKDKTVVDQEDETKFKKNEIDYEKISEDIVSIKEPSEEIEKDVGEVEEVGEKEIENNKHSNHLVLNEIEEVKNEKDIEETKSDVNVEEKLGEEK